VGKFGQRTKVTL